MYLIAALFAILVQAAVVNARPGAEDEVAVRVGPGDTLRTIAMRELGDELFWRHLMEWNKVGDGALVPGGEIRYPKSFRLLSLPYPLGTLLPVPDSIESRGRALSRAELAGLTGDWWDAACTSAPVVARVAGTAECAGGLAMRTGLYHSVGGRAQVFWRSSGDGGKWHDVDPRLGPTAGDPARIAESSPGRCIAVVRAGDLRAVPFRTPEGFVIAYSRTASGSRVHLEGRDSHGALRWEDDRRLATVEGRIVPIARRHRRVVPFSAAGARALAAAWSASATALAGAVVIRELYEWGFRAFMSAPAWVSWKPDTGFSDRCERRVLSHSARVWFDRVVDEDPIRPSPEEAGSPMARVVWSRTSSSAVESYIFPVSDAEGVAILGDVLLGLSHDPSRQMVLSRFDEAGRMKWSTKLPQMKGGCNCSEALLPGSAGGWLAVGSVGHERMAVEVTTAGLPGAVNGIQRPLTDMWGGSAIALTAQGHLVMGSFVHLGSTSVESPMLEAHDRDGRVVWSRSTGTESGLRWRTVGSRPPGGVVALAGWWTIGAFAEDGSPLWERTSPVAARKGWARRLAAGADGSVYVVGRMPSLTPGCGQDWIVEGYDATGTLKWSRSHNAMGLTESAQVICVAADGTVVVGGNEQIDVPPSQRKGGGAVIGYDPTTGMTRWLFRQEYEGFSEQIDGIAAGPGGDVYVCGSTWVGGGVSVNRIFRLHPPPVSAR